MRAVCFSSRRQQRDDVNELEVELFRTKAQTSPRTIAPWWGPPTRCRLGAVLAAIELNQPALKLRPKRLTRYPSVKRSATSLSPIRQAHRRRHGIREAFSRAVLRPLNAYFSSRRLPPLQAMLSGNHTASRQHPLVMQARLRDEPVRLYRAIAEAHGYRQEGTTSVLRSTKPNAHQGLTA